MKKAITLTVFLLLFSSQAIADQIVLKNGDRLTGKIVKSDGSKLVVQTELICEVSVDLSAVNSISSDQPLYVMLADGRTVSGIITVSENKAELRAANSNAVSIDRATGDSNNRSSAEAQAGQTLEHRLSSRLSLKEQLFFFPNLTRGGEYRINFDSSLVTDITRRIGWQLTLSDRYLSNPPLGFEKNDLILTTGLKIKPGELK